MVDTKATCTEDGVHTEKCANCGDVVTETTPATGHDWVEIERIEAQPGIPGKIVEKCQNCGETKETEIPALPVTEDVEETIPEDTEDETEEPDNTEDVLGDVIPQPEDDTEEPDNDPDVLGDYVPQTGDNTNVSLYLLLMIISLVGMIALRKKEA
jgi:LPXTG-motif cell wall-anchored protein